MSDALALARAAAEAHPRGIAGAAGEIGFSRTALSLYLAGKYAASDSIERAILARYDVRGCPHTGQEIAAEACRRRARSPKPYGGMARELQWLACQACANRPEKE